MQIIPIIDAPAQTLQITLAGQQCQIDLTVKSTGLFANLYLGGVLMLGGVACVNRARLVRSLYLGFAGDLVFVDTQGSADPTSPGLGSRWLLYYLEVADLGGLG